MKIQAQPPAAPFCWASYPTFPGLIRPQSHKSIRDQPMGDESGDSTGASSSSAPKSCAPAVTTSSPSTPSTGKARMVYTADDIDVLVAHIIPLDIWYVLPIEAFAPCKSLRFYPQGGCKRPRFEHYREAWHLLRSDHQQ